MLYSLETGPAEDRYTVETPWTPEGVRLTLQELSQRCPWLAKGFDAHLCMLVQTTLLDYCVIDPMDGTGATITGAEIRASLDTWSSFDRAKGED